MKARIAKKIVKKQEKLAYQKGTIKKAEAIVKRNSQKDSE
tara:strand:+ start:438 stop:557 length:120 start_codon:yes stop_codon:yes gene_type:complete